MAELVMVKRGALQKGELGLFIDTEIFSDDFATIKQGTDITVQATQDINPKQFRLFWALMGKIAKSGVLGDIDTREVADYILMKCRWVRYVTTNFRGGTDTIPVVKSFRPATMDGTVFNRVFDRALYIITSEILPDMPASKLRDDVEKMAGVTGPYAAEPAPPPARAPRKPRAPKPVSVIPPDDQPAPSSADEPAPPNSPAAMGEPAAQATIPKTPEEWVPWCNAWLNEAERSPAIDAAAIKARWSKEMGLRNDIGVTSEIRGPVFERFMQITSEKKS